MKILTKYKDYYDYLQGIYGVDDKLILDRRDTKPLYINNIITLYICDYVIQGYHHNDKFYFGKDLDSEDLKGIIESSKVKSKSKWYIRYFDFKENDPRNPTHRVINDKGNTPINANLIEDEMMINQKLDCPILIRSGVGSVYNVNQLSGNLEDYFIKFPKLSDLGISGVLPPEKIWVMLSDWLSQSITRNEKKVPIGDDKLRIQTHGFDLKTSFRPKMK